MPKKVFELAKELDIGPLDLVESLKAKGFAVRNHMAELSDSDVASYLAAVKKDDDSKEESAAKKKVVRKKAPAVAVKAVEKKTVERKAAPVEEADETDKKTTKKASTVKKKVTVIRRKTDDADMDEEANFSDSDEADEVQATFEADEEAVQVQEPEAIEASVEEETTEEVAKVAQPTTGGLRVVSKPVVKKDTPNEAGVITRKAADRAAEKAASIEEKKLSTIDRPHRFTPVYTPSKDPNFKENQAKEE
ncbi:MAG: hypothetical protein K2Q18_07070, partial [Bdellovibrionales bacterium]|nr:hypothetical protein [Bdellovibrionales bacterium]